MPPNVEGDERSAAVEVVDDRADIVDDDISKRGFSPTNLPCLIEPMDDRSDRFSTPVAGQEKPGIGICRGHLVPDREGDDRPVDDRLTERLDDVVDEGFVSVSIAVEVPEV